MRNKILVCLFIFLSFSLYISAENVLYDENNYQITTKEYLQNNKSYKAYKYFLKKEDLISKDFDTVYLMITSPSTQSIGSLNGHSFIVLSKESEFENSIAINFFGEHEGLNSIIKAMIGTTIGLPGYIDIRLFSHVAERYTIGQERTIFYYKLDISKQDILLLIDNIYALSNEDLTYQFLSHNCSNFSLNLFKSSLNLNFNDISPIIVNPSYLPIILEKSNLILERGSITPPITKVSREDINISEDLIKSKKEFCKANLNETRKNDKKNIYIPKKDLLDYGNIVDNFISQTSLGIIDNIPTFGFSIFSIKRYEQVQGPTNAMQINFIDIRLQYKDDLRMNNLTIFEINSYPKINYEPKLTTKLLFNIKTDQNNDLKPFVKGGLGLSFGDSNILFDITTDLEVPLSSIGLNLSINGELVLYNKFSYITFEGNIPIYNINTINDSVLKCSSGFILFNRINVEASYNLLNNKFEASVIYNFNPFYFGL